MKTENVLVGEAGSLMSTGAPNFGDSGAGDDFGEDFISTSYESTFSTGIDNVLTCSTGMFILVSWFSFEF